MALHLCGASMRSASKAELMLRLWLAARTVERDVPACPFRISRLAVKGLREIQLRREKGPLKVSALLSTLHNYERCRYAHVFLSSRHRYNFN